MNRNSSVRLDRNKEVEKKKDGPHSTVYSKQNVGPLNEDNTAEKIMPSKMNGTDRTEKDGVEDSKEMELIDKDQNIVSKNLHATDARHNSVHESIADGPIDNEKNPRPAYSHTESNETERPRKNGDHFDDT